MKMETELKNYLENNNVDYVNFKHRAVFTVGESRDLKKSIPGLHCKCLFMKDNSGIFYLVGMPAEKRLNVWKLRAHLRVKKLHFASADELFDKLGLKPGSVSIFGLVNNLDRDVVFILDKQVFDAEYAGFHPNINTATIVLKHEDLERFYNSVKNNKLVLQL